MTFPSNLQKNKIKRVLLGLFCLSLLALFAFSLFQDREQTADNVVQAEVLEVGEIIDEQGLLLQQFKVETETGVQFDLEVNTSQIKGRRLDPGRDIYLLEVDLEDRTVYEYISYQKSSDIMILFAGLSVFALLTLGLNGIRYTFPTLVIIIFFIFGYNLIFFQSTWGYGYLLLLVLLTSLISMLITVKSYRLAFLITAINLLMVLFTILLSLLAVEMLGLIDLYFQFSFFRANLIADEFAKLFITAIATIAYGLVLHANFTLPVKIANLKNQHKQIVRINLINRAVEFAQGFAGRQVNVITYLLIGFASLWVFLDSISASLQLIENFFVYKFLLILMILTVTIIVNAYLTALFTALLYDYLYADRKKPETD